MRSSCLTAVCVAIAAVTTTSPVHGQVVKGRVLLAGTEQLLPDVLVRLRFPDGRQATSMVTDSSGTFRLHAPRTGPFSLEASRLGMASITTSELRVNVSEELEVELQMAETAVPLDPLVVKARTARDIGLLAGYFDRIERQQRLGLGHVITRDRIEERDALDVSDLLRDLPSISVVQGADRMSHVLFRSSRGQCAPKVYLNGMRQNRGGAAGVAAVVDETVRPHELEGVEVYRGVSEMPGEFYDESHCGVILLWTRRDAEGGRPFTWRRLLFGLGAAAAFLYLIMR